MSFKKYINWKLLFKEILTILFVVFSLIGTFFLIFLAVENFEKHPILITSLFVLFLVIITIWLHISKQRDLERLETLYESLFPGKNND